MSRQNGQMFENSMDSSCQNGGRGPSYKKLLYIAATSTSSERVFSVCGTVPTERRCRLRTEYIGGELVLWSKYRISSLEKLEYFSQVHHETLRMDCNELESTHRVRTHAVLLLSVCRHLASSE